MIHDKIDEPMEIIISGVEPDPYWNLVVQECKTRTVLMSYQYLKKRAGGFLAKRIGQNPDTRVFIDSGAHTFLTDIETYSEKDEEFWESYIEEYTDFIRKNKDFIFACADLDIDDIVGVDKVNEWREKYFEPLEKEGVQVCYIWHLIRGEKGWEDMCRKYSYIGLTVQNDKTASVQRLMKRINVAKRYNTRVHGMALTKTEMLARVPFYTVDSTTWLVGQQFGELNLFDGRRMKRILKKDWRRTCKTKLVNPPYNADWDRLTKGGKLGDGNTYELLKMNLISYRLLEEYARKRLGSKMYWMVNRGAFSTTKHLPKRKKELPKRKTKAVAVKQSSSILPTFSADNSFSFPTSEWFNGNMEDWVEYAKEFNIDADTYTKDECINILYYYYMLLDATEEELDSLEDSELINYAKSVVNEDIEDRSTAIKELKAFFQDNLDGVRNDFKGEPAPVSIEERANYLTEDPFAIIDLDEDSVNELCGTSSPKESDMPEVDAYDKELQARGITPVRDSKGRFIKGQQRIRKPKNIYSKQYPKLACDTCYKSGDCPYYKQGKVCAMDKLFKRFDTRNIEDVLDAIYSLSNITLERLQKALLFETMDGGMPTGEVTELINQSLRLVEKAKSLKEHSPNSLITQTKVVNSDGSQQIVTEMKANPQSGGLLSKIFGSALEGNEEDSEKDKAVDAEIIE